MGFNELMKSRKEVLDKEKEEEELEKVEKKNKLTPFTFINQICFKSRKEPYNKSKGSAFVTSMHFSHDRELIDIVNKINGLQYHLKDDIIYEYYWYAVPRGKRFIKWVKKTPVKKKYEDEVEKLVIEEHLSKREAKLTLRFKEKLNR